MHVALKVNLIPHTHKYNVWITGGIKALCCNERILYVSFSGNNVTSLTLGYERFCKILTCYKNSKRIIVMN